MTKSDGSKTAALKTAKPRQKSPGKTPRGDDGLVLTGSHASAKLLVADQFRMEIGGKILAIGLYADNVVVIPKEAPTPTPEMPLALELSLLVTITGVAGKGPVAIQLGDMPPKEMHVELKPNGSANLVLNLQPLFLKDFGQKSMLVTFAGGTHELSFEVRRGEAE